MKKLNGYETAQAYFEQERLPVGGLCPENLRCEISRK